MAGYPRPRPRPDCGGRWTRSAVGTGTKRTEWAPPRAKARLSNTCKAVACHENLHLLYQHWAVLLHLAPIPGGCIWSALREYSAHPVIRNTSVQMTGNLQHACAHLIWTAKHLAAKLGSWNANLDDGSTLLGLASWTMLCFRFESGPSTRQRASLKWFRSAFHSGCLLSTCQARGNLMQQRA